MPEKKSKQKVQNLNWKQELTLYMHDLIYMIAAIFIVFLVVFRVIIVSGSSMYDTLMERDYLLLVSSLFYREPQAQDIVVIRKESFDNGSPIIKRVIATEGQTVDIDFEAGIVYVDGEALEEPYTYTPTNSRQGMSFPLTVAENCVFVLGDNRNGSRDSRDPIIGQIDKREILGKAVFLFLPAAERPGERPDFDRIGAIK